MSGDSGKDVVECERNVAACELKHGAAHMKTARALFDLVLALWPLGRYDEAIADARRALEIALAEADDDWWFVRMVRGALGCLLSAAGFADEALPLLRHEAELADRTGQPADRLSARWFLGEALLRAQLWSEALECFEIVLPIAEARKNERQVQAMRAYIAEARAKLRDD